MLNPIPIESNEGATGWPNIDVRPPYATARGHPPRDMFLTFVHTFYGDTDERYESFGMRLS